MIPTTAPRLNLQKNLRKNFWRCGWPTEQLAWIHANYSQLNKKSRIKESAESRQLTKTPASSWTDLFLWFQRSRESTYQVDLAPQSNQQLLGVLLEGQDRIFRLGVLSGQLKVLAGKSLDLPDQLFVPGEVNILG